MQQVVFHAVGLHKSAQDYLLSLQDGTYTQNDEGKPAGPSQEASSSWEKEQQDYSSTGEASCRSSGAQPNGYDRASRQSGFQAGRVHAKSCGKTGAEAAGRRAAASGSHGEGGSQDIVGHVPTARQGGIERPGEISLGRVEGSDNAATPPAQWGSAC